jgi:riboflavin kinase/FMN adenylyltransferase
VPADGVYAVRAHLPDGSTHPAMLNIGHRPTVGGTTRTVEAHVLGGFDADLYDQPLTVTFVARLRDEQKFSGLEALKMQLHLDAVAALAILV